MRRADLHVHTHASSDASFDPEEVFSVALARGLTALTFSDHDCIDSIAEGQRLSTVYGLTFLPGIEITSSWRGEPAHILGFFPDGPLPSLEEFLAEKFRAAGVQLRRPLVPESIRACHEAGGIAVVAHPGHDTGVVFTFDEESITALAAEGLDGVEVWHPAHTEAQEEEYARVADRLGLVKTGGSDMHIPRPEPQKMVGGTYCDWDEVLRYLER